MTPIQGCSHGAIAIAIYTMHCIGFGLLLQSCPVSNCIDILEIQFLF